MLQDTLVTRGTNLGWRLGLLALLLCQIAPGLEPVSAAAQDEPTPLAMTHGVAAGDVRATSAVIWARANRDATVQVAYAADPALPLPRLKQAEATAAADFTAQVRLDELQPNTAYWYQATLEGPGPAGEVQRSPPVTGSFRTLPAADDGRMLQLLFGGDLGGMQYCRRVDRGYAIFAAMQALQPDLFIFNGDLIYADWDCPTNGPRYEGGRWLNVAGDFVGIADPAVDWTDRAAVRENYLRHWRYNRADEHLQRLLASTALVAHWDDHEVISDFGGGWSQWHAEGAHRDGYPNLVEAGREAFFNWVPFDRDLDEPDRIYRGFRLGKHAELLILDGRSYRDRNDQADDGEQPKTLVGQQQRSWLIEQLARSNATWKLVSSDIPISIPSGRRGGSSGRDSWANGTNNHWATSTGFERELLELLRELDRRGVRNLVFLVTDVHFAQFIVHEIDLDGDGRPLVFHQLTAGPLSAERDQPRELDPTLQPTLLYAEGGLFNFGYLRIEPLHDGRAQLVAEIRGEDGQPRPGSQFVLAPR